MFHTSLVGESSFVDGIWNATLSSLFPFTSSKYSFNDSRSWHLQSIRHLILKSGCLESVPVLESVFSVKFSWLFSQFFCTLILKSECSEIEPVLQSIFGKFFLLFTKFICPLIIESKFSELEPILQSIFSEFSWLFSKIIWSLIFE